ncbi:hypothetical protein VN12_06515 [Pirellula sp. SH-Sr6A]|nr:hypothetical protein VN12_06515 [Pirellula sp. SH-Sr6A]
MEHMGRNFVDPAHVLVDCFWKVLLDEFGDQARSVLPPSVRERLNDGAHLERCIETIMSLRIKSVLAQRALGLEGYFAG